MRSSSFAKHIDVLEKGYTDRANSSARGFRGLPHPQNLTVVAGRADASTNPDDLAGVFNDLPFHDTARYKVLFNAYKEMIDEATPNTARSHLSKKDDSKGLQLSEDRNQAVKKYIDLLSREACRDLLEDTLDKENAVQLKDDIVKTLNLNTFYNESWAQWRNTKQSIINNLTIAYLSEYMTKRFQADYDKKFPDTKDSKHNKYVEKNLVKNELKKQFMLEKGGDDKRVSEMIKSAYQKVQLEKQALPLIKKFIDMDGGLKSDAAREARANMIEALLLFWINNYNKISKEGFEEVCVVAMNVLLIRQKYDVEKGDFRQSTDKNKMMAGIENRMIRYLNAAVIKSAVEEKGEKDDLQKKVEALTLLDPLDHKVIPPDAKDIPSTIPAISSSMRYMIEAQYEKLEQKKDKGSLFTYMDEAQRALFPHAQVTAYAMYSDVIDLKSSLGEDANLARNRMIATLANFWVDNTRDPLTKISRDEFREVCRMAQSVLAVRQQYDIDKAPKSFFGGQSAGKKGIMTAIEDEMVKILGNREVSHDPRIPNKDFIGSIGLDMVKYIQEQEKKLDQKTLNNTFHNYLGETSNALSPYYKDLPSEIAHDLTGRVRLNDEGNAARNKMVKALYAYRERDSKMTPEEFSTIGSAVHQVLSIRQQYYPQKTKISKVKLGVITNIEKAMIELLNPSKKADAKDAKQLLASSPAEIIQKMVGVIKGEMDKVKLEKDQKTFYNIMKAVHGELSKSSYDLSKKSQQKKADVPPAQHKSSSPSSSSSTVDLVKSLAASNKQPDAPAPSAVAVLIASAAALKEASSPPVLFNQSKAAAAAAPVATPTPAPAPSAAPAPASPATPAKGESHKVSGAKKS